MVVGAGYRFLDERVGEGFTFTINPRTVDETIVNAFAQDEIALGRRVHLTLGGKLERDSYAGWKLQPTARLMWSPAAHQHVWAAASRAVHSPSLGDMSGRYNFTSFIGAGGLPVVVGALGNPDFQPETVLDVEAGYRAEIGSVASVDVTAFRASYHNLKTSEPLAPRMELTPAPMHLFIPAQFGNLLAATTSGVEIAAHWTPVAAVRFDGGYSTFLLTPHLSPASRDAAAASFDGSAPRAQWYARSAATIAPRVPDRRHAVPRRRAAHARRPRLHAPRCPAGDVAHAPGVPGDCRTEPDRSRSCGVRRTERHRHPDAHSSIRTRADWLPVFTVTKAGFKTSMVKFLPSQLRARQDERDRAEQELRQSEERYRLLFDQNPQSMWVYDLETLEFLEVNEAAVRAYGYSRAEFLGMRLTGIRHADDVPRLTARMASDRGPWAPKPFTADALARKVREVLDAPLAPVSPTSNSL